MLRFSRKEDSAKSDITIVVIIFVMVVKIHFFDTSQAYIIRWSSKRSALIARERPLNTCSHAIRMKQR